MTSKPLIGAVKAFLLVFAAIGSVLASGAVASADDLLRAQILAGHSERLRMLDIAEELEAMDTQESVLWEQIIVILPPREGGSKWLQEERELRRDLLPYLSARQSAFRQKERGLLGDAATSSPNREVSKDAATLASLEAVRYWSALIDNMQFSARARLDAMHILVLARTNLEAVPDKLAEQLSRAGRYRRDVESERIRARQAWTTSGNALQLERISGQLERAEEMVDTALDSEPLVTSLQHQVKRLNAGPHRRLLSAIADQASQSIDHLAWKATDLAGAGWGRPASFLQAFPGVDPKDEELHAAVAQHRQLASGLLVSLAGRADLIAAMKHLANSREQLFTTGTKYLAQREADHQSALTALREDALETWKAIDDLRALAGRIETAAETPDRALAAAVLGSQFEKAVFLEGMIFEMEFGQIADPFPAPHDPRLAAEARAWRHGLERWISLQNEWQDWKQRWDERVGREHRSFMALRELAGRLEALRATRLQRFVASVISIAVPADNLGTGMAALHDEARRQLTGLQRAQTALAQSLKDVADDPVIRAALTAAGSEDWSQAVLTASALKQLEEQIGVLRSASMLMAAAQDERHSTTERLESLVQLGRGLAIPWWVDGSEQAPRARTIIAGREFVVDNLLMPERLQLRRRDDYFVGGPLHLAALSPVSGLLAQSTGTPQAGRNRGLEGLKPIAQELGDDLVVFAAMPLVGGCVGGACGMLAGGVGAVPGALAGASAGGAAALEGAAVDVAAGTVKGHIVVFSRDLADSGLVSPATAKSVEYYGAEAVSYVKAALSLKEIFKSVTKTMGPPLAALYKRGFKLPTALESHQLRNLSRAVDEVKAAKDSLALVEERLMREVGGVAYRDWSGAMDRLEKAQALASRWESVKAMLPLEKVPGMRLVKVLAEGISSVLGNLNDVLFGVPGEKAQKLVAEKLGISVPDWLTAKPLPPSPKPVLTGPKPETTPAAPAVVESRQSIEEKEKERLDQLHKWQQAAKPPPPMPPAPLPDEEPSKKKTPDDRGTVPEDPSKGMNEYDPVKAFAEREQRRSNDVGITNLPGFGVQNPSKFGSDDLKRGVKSNLDALAENQREKDLKRNTGTHGDSSGGSTSTANRCAVDSDCPTGYKCDALAGICAKPQQTSGGTGAIPLCTTDRDCRTGKCVSNVCTQGSSTQSSSSTAASTQASAGQGKKAYYLVAHEYIYQKPECKKFRWRTYEVAYLTVEEVPAFRRDLEARLPRYSGMQNLTIEVRILGGPSTTPIKAPNPEVLCLLVY